MKRIGNLYTQTFSIENLMLADKIARRRKANQEGVKIHDQKRGCNIIALHNMLMDNTFQTSSYKNFTLYDPKEREISALPFYPDRIVHHTAMLTLEPVFVSTFTNDTYSCIKGRGIHAASLAIKRALKDVVGTQYCLKLDIKKFYPSIDHAILKLLLRRKIKDNDLLSLLDEIIDSAPGVPIGNYLSQYFANFYLTYFDHWLKEVIGVKYYVRYADDMIILADGTAYLRNVLQKITLYLHQELKLAVKGNWQIFQVKARGINMVGYVHFHTHTLLRPSIKRNYARTMKRRPNRASVGGYQGWANPKHCNCLNLNKKLLNEHNKNIQLAGCKIKEPDRRQNRDG